MAKPKKGDDDGASGKTVDGSTDKASSSSSGGGAVASSKSDRSSDSAKTKDADAHATSDSQRADSGQGVAKTGTGKKSGDGTTGTVERASDDRTQPNATATGGQERSVPGKTDSASASDTGGEASGSQGRIATLEAKVQSQGDAMKRALNVMRKKNPIWLPIINHIIGRGW